MSNPEFENYNWRVADMVIGLEQPLKLNFKPGALCWLHRP
jgi:hypothetical protein